MRCQGQTRSGAPCRMHAMHGQTLCYTHSPTVAAERRRARVLGGQRTRTPYAAQPAAVATVGDLQHHLAQTLADTLKLPNTSTRSGSLARLLALGVELLDAGQLSDRVAALEEMAETRKKRP